MNIKMSMSKFLIAVLVLFSIGAQALVTDSANPAGSVEHSGSGGFYEKAKAK